MIEDIYFKKKLVSSWFSLLQQTMCYEFEKIEIDFGKQTKQKPKYFKKKNWSKSKKEGGGTYAIIKEGLIFDSVGVNFSEVSGKFQKKFRSQILGATKNPNYWNHPRCEQKRSNCRRASMSDRALSNRLKAVSHALTQGHMPRPC